MLYAFHRLIGRADNELQEALDQLEEAGHAELADAVRGEVVGRNVIEGRWSFQIVEDFDDGYWTRFREAERVVRDQLVGRAPARVRVHDEGAQPHARPTRPRVPSRRADRTGDRGGVTTWRSATS